MSNVARSLVSVACLTVAAFCVFGFMASFEPGVAVGWKIGYASLFVAFVAASVVPWLRRRS